MQIVENQAAMCLLFFLISTINAGLVNGHFLLGTNWYWHRTVGTISADRKSHMNAISVIAESAVVRGERGERVEIEKPVDNNGDIR